MILLWILTGINIILSIIGIEFDIVRKVIPVQIAILVCQVLIGIML